MRPLCCRRCGKVDAFHSHGRYQRFVDDLEIYVARFRCISCALDLSVLPRFAMPYRNRSVEVVDHYFRASDEERRKMGGHDTLRRYWEQWEENWQVVARTAGVMADCARMAWQSLIERFGSIALGQCKLVNRYGQAFLRSYIVHAVNENDAFVQ